VQPIALAGRLSAERRGESVYPRLRECRLSCWLVEATKDWIWEVDASGRYTYSGPKVKELLGYEPEEVIGRSFFDLMPDYEAARIRAEFETWAQAGIWPRQLEALKVAKDTRVVRLESVVIPLLGSRGEFEGYGGLDRDPAQPKNAPDAMAWLDGEVAHDLNNRLAVVLGETELLKDTADKQQLRGILAIGEAAREASFLNQDLRAFCRIQALAAQPSDLGLIFTNATALLQRLLSKHICLNIEIGHLFKSARTDPTPIQQVLMALAMNLRKMMTGGGSVRIKISSRRFAQNDPLRPAGVVPGDYVLLETTATGKTTRGNAHPFRPLSNIDRTMKGTVQQYEGYVHGQGSMNDGEILTILLPTYHFAEPDEKTGPRVVVERNPSSDRRGDFPVT